MNYKKLEYAINVYTLNPESAAVNFEVACCYDELKQTASAISHYLRCAERTEDKKLQYECMLRAGISIKNQGKRLYTEKSFFQNAISILPNRPEAYFYIAETLFNMGRQHDAFTMICIAENFHINNKEKLILNNCYNGLCEIKFKKYTYGKSCGIVFFGEDSFLNNLECNKK